VWDITIETIRARHPAAIKLLHILACYAPDNLPRLVLSAGDDSGQLAVDEALGALASYSMITLTADTVSTHRLVRAVILVRSPAEDDSQGFGGESPQITALEWLEEAIPADPRRNVAGWPLWRALVPHAQSVAALFPVGEQPEKLIGVQHELAQFHDSQGQYEQALPLRESALAISEAVLGPDHSKTGIMLFALAYAYWRLGRHAEALTLERKALEIIEATLGPGHPQTAAAMNNLAGSYYALSQFDQSLSLLQRALAITESALGPDHPDVATRLNNLSATYLELGRGHEALPLQQRALAITESALGPDHPETAIRLTILAIAYRKLGRSHEALPLLQRALAITEGTLGPDHPNMASIERNLTAIYRELGRGDERLRPEAGQ
jgi:tetratricopeptide (TPR) repeat protein